MSIIFNFHFKSRGTRDILDVVIKRVPHIKDLREETIFVTFSSTTGNIEISHCAVDGIWAEPSNSITESESFSRLCTVLYFL